MKFLVALLPLLALAQSAPQQFVIAGRPRTGLTSATTSSQAHQIGNTHVSHNSKSVQSDTSAVHRFDSRSITPQTVLRRRVVSPLAGTTTTTSHVVSPGTFAVAAAPSATVVRTAAAAVPAAAPGSTLFQTADGRFFALNTQGAPVSPGQLFQTPDGRFFTVGGAAAAETAEEDDDDNVNDDALIVAERLRAEEEEEEEEIEEEEEEEAEPANTRATVLRNNILANTNTPVFFTSQPRTTLLRSGVGATHLVHNTPSVVRTVAAAPQATHLVHNAAAVPSVVRTVAAAPQVVRTVAAPATTQVVSHDLPIAHSFRTFPTALRTHAFSNADVASHGFYVVGDQGQVAYEF